MGSAGTAAKPGTQALQPRQYQQDLFEAARKRNVIAYLDTGSGKTLVAVLLIKDKSGSLRQDGKKKVSVFLAPKVVLVQQQANVLRAHTALRVSQYSGDIGADLWDIVRWQREFESNDVWVMTPQVLLNILRHAFITISDMNLLIFDECHRVTKKDPSNLIMQEFYHPANQARGQVPHVFGMTASPVNMNAQDSTTKMAQAVKQLEGNLDAEIITVFRRDEVEGAAPMPKLVKCDYVRTVRAGLLEESIGWLDLMGTQLSILDVRQQFLQKVLIARQQEQMHQCSETWGRPHTEHGGHEHNGSRQNDSSHKTGAHSKAVVAAARNLGFPMQLTLQGLVLDDEKVHTASGQCKRHLLGLKEILEDLGPWCAAVALMHILQPQPVSITWEHMNMVVQAASEAKARGGLSEAEAAVLQAARAKSLGAAKEAVAINAAWKGAALLLMQLLPVPAEVHMRLAAETVKIGNSSSSNPKAQLRGIVQQALQAVPPAFLEASAGHPKGSPEAIAAQAGVEAFTVSDTGAHSNTRPVLLSGKMQLLVQELLSRKVAATMMSNWSSIIFATRKLTVLALKTLLQSMPSLKFLKVDGLMGYGGPVAAGSVTGKKQTDMIAKLRAGELNCLVSTAVAEEGLDIKQCQLVARFDLPHTSLAFVQSRGRARAVNSHYLVLVEKGNMEHSDMLNQVASYEAKIQFHAKQQADMNRSQNGDDALQGFDKQQAAVLAPARGVQEYCVQATGASVNLDSSRQLLFMFCQKLPFDRYTMPRPRFSTRSIPGTEDRFTGEPLLVSVAVLPNNCPVRLAVGLPQRTRSLAVASAALEACALLHQAGALSDHLLPEVDAGDEDELEDDLVVEQAKHLLPVSARAPTLLRLDEKLARHLNEPVVRLHLYAIVLTLAVKIRRKRAVAGAALAFGHVLTDEEQAAQQAGEVEEMEVDTDDECLAALTNVADDDGMIPGFGCEARNVLQQQYGVLTLRELPLGIMATQQELHLPIPYSNDQVQVQVEARGRVEVTQEQLKLMQRYHEVLLLTHHKHQEWGEGMAAALDMPHQQHKVLAQMAKAEKAQTTSGTDAAAEPTNDPVGSAAKQADNPQQPREQPNDSGSQPMDTAAPEQAKPATAPLAPKPRVTKELLVKPPESMLSEDPGLAEDLRVQAQWAAKAQGSWYIMVPLNKGGQEQAPPGSRSSEAAADVREVSAPELRSSFFASLAPAFVPRVELLPPDLPRPDEAGARKLDWQAICQASKGFQKVIGEAGEGTVLTETVRQPPTFKPRPGGVDFDSREGAPAAAAATKGTAEAATGQQQQGVANDTSDNGQQPQGQEAAGSTRPAAVASGGQQRGTADGQATPQQQHHGQAGMADEEPFDPEQQPIPSVALVVTTYNWAPHDLMSVRDDLTPASTFPGGQQSIREAAEKATLYAGSLKKKEPEQAAAGESGSTIATPLRAAECVAAAAAAKLPCAQQEAGQQGATGDGAPGTVSSLPEHPEGRQQGSTGAVATGSGSGLGSAAAGSPPEREEEDLFAVCKGLTGLPEWLGLQSPLQQNSGAVTKRGGLVQPGQPAQSSGEEATGLHAGSAPPVGQGKEAGAAAAPAHQEPSRAGVGTVPQPVPKQAAGSSAAPSKVLTEAAARALSTGQMSCAGPAAASGAAAAAAPTATERIAAEASAAAAKRSAATAEAGAPPTWEVASPSGSSALLPISQQMPAAARVAVDPHLPVELSAQAMIQVMEHSARALAALVQSQDGPDPESDWDPENGHGQGWVDDAVQLPEQQGPRVPGSPARPGAPAMAELAGDLEATTAEAAVCKQVLQNGGKRSAEGGGEPKERRRKRCKRGNSLWSFARYYSVRWGLEGLVMNQPLIQARHAQPSREKPNQGGPLILVPQLCLMHPLTQSGYHVSKVLPLTMHKIQQRLLGAELREQHLAKWIPDGRILLEAFTPRACLEQYSYERLELLGDAFLKLAASLHLFRRFPRAHEGQLTSRKIRIISNANLIRVASQHGLTDFMLNAFKREAFASPGVAPVAPGQGTALKPKAAADIVEAVIGAALVCPNPKSPNQLMNTESAAQLLDALGVLPASLSEHDTVTVGSWQMGEPTAKEDEKARDDAAEEAQASDTGDNGYCLGVEAILNYKFRDKSLLLEALTHTSWPDSSQQGYQRLEFLGDAVLDLLMTTYFYHTHKGSPPGQLSDLRSASVNNTRLATVAVLHKLHTFVRHHSPLLFADISTFVAEVQAAVAAEMAEDRADTPGQHPGQPGSPVPAPAPTQQQAAVNSSQQNGGPTQDTHMTTADAFHTTTTSAMALALSDSQSLPGHQATTSLPLDISMAAASQCRTQSAVPEDPATREAAKAAALSWASKHTYNTMGVAVPKALADVVEALIGAVYLDSNCNDDRTWQVILPLMQPMLDPETVPVHPGRALLELCQQQGKQLRFAVASTLPDALLLAAQTLGLPEGEAPSAELVALAAEAATKVSVGSPAAEAGTGAAAGAAGSAEKAGATAPLAAGGNGMAGNKEAEKAPLPKPVLTPLQQHFHGERTAYMVALVDEKPASRVKHAPNKALAKLMAAQDAMERMLATTAFVHA